MKQTELLLMLLIAGIFLTLASCTKDKIENKDTLNELYKTFENGIISECQHNGKQVYSAGINAYDASGSIYDEKGNIIGSCNYAWGQPDPICRELESCEVIYRVDNNIWGRPAVNKYGLGK